MVVVVAEAAVGRPAPLEEIHQREVDPLSGKRVDDPRTAGRPDTVAAAGVNRRAADEAAGRAGGGRVPRHSAPVTATLQSRRRVALAASAVH